MVKRKRDDSAAKAAASGGKTAKKQAFAETGPASESKYNASTSKPNAPAASISEQAIASTPAPAQESSSPISVQIVTGSYERILHGFAATLQPSDLVFEKPRVLEGGELRRVEEDQVESRDQAVFSDTFLFAAHSSSLRCLALSQPTEGQKRILATGGTDERINLYNLSTAPPGPSSRPNLPNLSNTSVLENPRNRELGSLLHHASSVTKLQFPTKGKLFSAAEDNTIAISRARDWTVLSTIKVPIPKPVGRPSGDTAAPGEVPAGVNDFAVHPSMKLMVSVGKGEKSMRLWNLVTGKKAGVLNFDKDILQQVGEGRHGTGEGRNVLWTDRGDDFVVGFERGAVVFGMDSRPRATIVPHPPTKLHHMRFLPPTTHGSTEDVLAVSTEDGRIIFYDLKTLTPKVDDEEQTDAPKHVLAMPHPACAPIAELGGPAVGLGGRIKDFEVLDLPQASHNGSSPLLVIAGSSDGAVRLWKVDARNFSPDMAPKSPATVFNAKDMKKPVANGTESEAPQIGTLLGTQETGGRITCLAAFVMDGPAKSATDADAVVASAAGDEDKDDSGSGSDSE